MVKTLASFVWGTKIPDDEPPFARLAVEELVTALRACGLDVSPPEDQQYAWGVLCRLAHLRMDCQLGPIGGEPERWLLVCYPLRGWPDWWGGRWREEEQKQFLNRVDAVLRAEGRVIDLRWYTKQEWDRAGD